MSLPAPDAVPDRAATVADRSTDSVNVVVAGIPDPEAVTLTDDGYTGWSSGALGRLAAATDAVDAAGATLHAPIPDFSASGPWLVVEPLAGRLATVAKGTGTATVTLPAPSGHLDARVRELRDRIDAVLEAARPSHERYPVDRDEFEAFTPGLTTTEPSAVAIEDDGVTVTLDVGTTPATTAAAIRQRFEDLEAVQSVTVTFDHGVERATPPAALRDAAEAALAETLGDWTYEWLPGPSLFTQVPATEKLAVGTGHPDAESFSADAYHQLGSILTATLEGYR
ncbi:MAG: hypothetical protein ABEJ57_03375 [Halobacteriaceae archaeon]